MLYQVEQDSRRLEDNKVSSASINEHRDSAIRIEFDEPRFFLPVGPNVYFLDAEKLDHQQSSNWRCEGTNS